jgi:hypothetical protein
MFRLATTALQYLKHRVTDVMMMNKDVLSSGQLKENEINAVSFFQA